MIRHLISALLLMCIPLWLHAVPIVKSFTLSNSKSLGTQVWGIAQHESKCMYFASNNGLLEFDGASWITHAVLNKTGVRSVMFDQESGRIYVGVSNDFGYFELNGRGQMIYHSLVRRMGNIGEVWAILRIGECIYFQAYKEVFKFNPITGDIQAIHFNAKINSVQSIKNVLVVATHDECLLMNGDLPMKIPDRGILKDKRVCAILPYKSHILFVTDLHGVYLFDGEQVSPYYIEGLAIGKEQIVSAAINGQLLVLGTVSSGVLLCDMESRSSASVNTSLGLQNNNVLALFFDQDGNLWLGLDRGVDYVLINSPEHSLLGTNATYGSGYASLLHQGTLYLGTNQGLYQMPYPLNTPFATHRPRLVPGMQGQVWGLTQVQGDILCAHDRGVFVIRNNTIKQVEPFNGVWKLMEMSRYPGYVLGCAYDGLFVLHKNQNQEWQFLYYLKGFHDSSGAFVEDEQGFVWFNQWLRGLYRLQIDPRQDTIQAVELFNEHDGLPSGGHNVPFQYNNGAIISSDKGFFKYNNQEPKSMLPVPAINNLFAATPSYMRLHQLMGGDMVLLSKVFQGVAFKDSIGGYTMDSVNLNYLKDQMIVGFESITSLDKSTVLFGTGSGFSVINLTIMKAQHKHPGYFGVFIKSVYITNNKDSILYGSRSLQSHAQVPQLSYKQNSLRFEFVAPEFRGDEGVVYSYYLQNYDMGWSDYSSASIKEYTGLAKGTYTFRVKAKSIFSPIEAFTEFKFKVLPPWYQSVWANTVYVALLLIGVWVLGVRLQRHADRKARQIERQKDIELQSQKTMFQESVRAKEKEIMHLQHERLEYDLRQKSQELANSTLHLIRKNEILLQIKDELSKIYHAVTERQDVGRVIKQIMKIQRDIHENVEQDNNWTKFEENFDFVYANYLKRLSIEFPQLNISDKKLCAYLKMNLASKEIAPLLNISVRSVEMARYRLRKKMGLGRSINLVDFLQSFQAGEPATQSPSSTVAPH